MSKHLLVIVVALVFLALSVILKKHRRKLLVLGVITLTLVNGTYSFAHAESILPSRTATTQTFYNTENLEIGEFPDAFLRVFLKGKTVYVKDDIWTLEDTQERGCEWLYSYYHVKNMVNFLKSVEADVSYDTEMNSVVISDEDENFDRLGYLNDLLRYSFVYSDYREECGSYLYYMWYYMDLTDTSYLYVHPESLDEEELVLIWQGRSEDNIETEDMYLCGRKYYEDNIR